jgi:hypothetical protein
MLFFHLMVAPVPEITASGGMLRQARGQVKAKAVSCYNWCYALLLTTGFYFLLFLCFFLNMLLYAEKQNWGPPAMQLQMERSRHEL